MNDRDLARDALTKVPAVTLGFWIIKILATTLGETGGDSVSMSWLGETTADAGEAGLNGYLVGTAIFGALLIVLVWAQVRAKRFNPWLYWGTIAASTTAGTTLADFSTRSLGIGYPGGSLLLFACVMLSLFAWYRTIGTVDINTVATPRAELFYWVTITFSQTLGTALGDWIADSALGYGGGALTVVRTTVDGSDIKCGTAPFFYPRDQGNTRADVDGLLVMGAGAPFRDGMPGSVSGLKIVDGSWIFRPIDVRCSVLSSWQADIVAIDADYQVSRTVRSQPCDTEAGN